jgi:hypothetical protein
VLKHFEKLVCINIADHHVRLGHIGQMGFQSSTQIIDGAVFVNRQLKFGEWLSRVERHKVDLYETLFFGRQRHGQVTEWIEFDGYFIAYKTVERGLEQTVKNVNYDAVVSLFVVLPRLFGKLLVRFANVSAHFDIGFLDDPVQIFVESVEQKSEQLVRVLLLKASELRRKSTQIKL